MKNNYPNLIPSEETELTLKRVKQLKEGKIYTLALDEQEVIAIYAGLSMNDGNQTALFKEINEDGQENGYTTEVFIETDKKEKTLKYKGKKK